MRVNPTRRICALKNVLQSRYGSRRGIKNLIIIEDGFENSGYDSEDS